MKIRKISCLLSAVVNLSAVCGMAGESIVRDGTFEREQPVEFHCANDGGSGGRFEIHTEDLSWNRCGRLIVGRKHPETASGKPVDVYSAIVRIGGEGRSGAPVEPNMVYEYSFDLKGAVAPVYAFFNEYQLVNGREVVKRGSYRDHVCTPGKDWRRFSGIHRTGANATRLELQLMVWTMEQGGVSAFREGDALLIDNVSIVPSARHMKMHELLKDPPECVRFAPYPVEADPACPFFPMELVDPPETIRFRAAVNEQKPLPVAIVNLSDFFTQYRVVLETVPEKQTGLHGVDCRDAGDFGLKGFPPEKIVVREALRIKDSDEGVLPTTRFDPLVSMNGASVISIPPKEVGSVWFDFDTHDVKPGVYCGRMRVIPLNVGSAYKVLDRRYVNGRPSEKSVPVEFTVDPIVLPRESVRPAHFCSPCPSEQGFALEADLGTRIYALGTYLFRPEAVGNPTSEFHRTVADYRRWAKARGVDVTFFVKYDAYNASQNILNPARDPAKRWEAWERYVRLVAQLMEEAGVPFSDYYVLVRDEPKHEEIPLVREAQERMKALFPKMQTYISACERIMGDEKSWDLGYLDELGPTTDLWAPTSRMLGNVRTLAKLRELKATKGAKILHYLCNTSMRESLTGYYRRHCWRGEFWQTDADMLYQFNQYCYGVRGDLCFKVAPLGEIAYKANGRFHPSVRYMAYREGMTDIKYLQTLRLQRGTDPAVAKFLAEAPASVVGSDASTPELLGSLREKCRTLLLDGNSR